MERKGRTNAEKQLRHVRMQLAAAQAAAAAAPFADAPSNSTSAAATSEANGQAPSEDPALGSIAAADKLSHAASSVAGIKGQHPPITMFPVRPIGYLQTCFSTR